MSDPFRRWLPIAVMGALGFVLGACADGPPAGGIAPRLQLSALPEDGGAFLTWYGLSAEGPWQIEQRAPQGTAWQVVASSETTSRSMGPLENDRRYAFRVRGHVVGGAEIVSAAADVTPRDRGRCSYPRFHPLFPRLSFFCTFDDLDQYLTEEGIPPAELRCRGAPVAWDSNVPNCVYTFGDDVLLLSRAADRLPAYQPLLDRDDVRTLARRIVWGADDPYGTPDAWPYEVTEDHGYSPGDVSGWAVKTDFRISYAGGRFSSRVTRYTPPNLVPGRLAIFHEGHDATARVLGADVISWLLARRWTVVAMDMPMVGQNARDAAAPLVNHNELWRLDDGGASPLAWLLLPVKAVVDGFIVEHPGDDRVVLMVGRSGGGWTTYLSGALDPRIDVAVAVAGGSPQSQRLLDVLEAWELGDYEQFFPQLYDVVAHENLIAAAGTRALFVAYTPRDPCCYRLGPEDPFFAWLAAAGAATGKPIVAAVDPEHGEHGLSVAQLEELDRFLAVHAPIP
ncbi:MAG: hypothetical protein FJ144_17715 [Deltaproteobacteria bacterium]|nr:hypothetical protein [Deltaproteobacteria bacterium]